MTDDSAGVLLTLAGLAYRGFQDVLPGDPHESVVRRVLVDGLDTLAPVHGSWGLVWGPVTSRMPFGAFDSNAMYVVRSRHDPRRYVVAVRGTNPVASPDWLFGDLWVTTMVRWPFDSGGGAAISTSTALGLASLLGTRWRPSSSLGRFGDRATAAPRAREGLFALARAGRAALAGATAVALAHPSAVETQLSRIVDHWMASRALSDALRCQFRHAAATLSVEPSDLRRKWLPPDQRDAGIDLLTFLKMQADRSDDGIEVTVTGHGKGGALASALALWLDETRESAQPAECWDHRGQARVGCHAFAAPTPGNAAFAKRTQDRLEDRHCHLRNTNDLVTRAWDGHDMREIPKLYGARTAALAPLLPGIAAGVDALDYRHAPRGEAAFAGPLDTARPLGAEIIYQHMNAYLAHLGILSPTLHAATFFI